MRTGLTGVVLAGGRSSRFGSDKALAEWCGTSLVESATASLLRHMPTALVVTRRPEELAFLRSPRVRVVADLHPNGHPLGGVHTALLALETSHAFVRACDMPFLQPGLVETLWEARAHFDAVIPVWRGARQPLCGVYSAACAGPARAAIERGELGVAALFDAIPTRFCLDAELAAVDPEGLSFMDIDTREDYERARRLLPC